MSTITKLYTFSSGATILAEEHNTNYDVLYNWANGNITNSNIKSGAAIALSKLDLTNDATLSGDLEFSGEVTFSGDMILGTANQGDIWYDDGTKLTRLTPGTDGQVLTTKGAAANPEWASLPDSVPTGTVMDFAGASAPTGYLMCDGATVSQATYASLYAVIGHTYGADPGGGNFILPNAKGRATIGAGQGSTYANGVDAAGTNFALAGSGGMEKHKLVTAELAAHTHSKSGYIVTSNNGTGEGGSTAGSVSNFGNVDSTGSGTAHNNLQPYIVFNKIIKT